MEDHRLKKIVTIVVMILLCSLFFFSSSDTMIRSVSAAPGASDWARTNMNYTLSFTPFEVCANNLYVFVMENTGAGVYANIVFRNNFTLKQRILLADVAWSPSYSGTALCNETYLYMGAREYSSGQGWDIGKYHIPDMALSARYTNTSWGYSLYFYISDTYLYASGQKSGGTAGMIQLYLSNLTQKAVGSHYYGGTPYYYRGTTSLDDMYVYGSAGIKTSNSGIGRFWVSNMTYKDSYLFGSLPPNMQCICTIPISGNIVSATAMGDSASMISCWDKNLSLLWTKTWSAGGLGVEQVYPYNQTVFISSERTGTMNFRSTSTGDIIWGYTGFNACYNWMDTVDNYLYVVGSYGSQYILRNVTIAAGSTPSPPPPPVNITFLYPCGIELFDTTPSFQWTKVNDSYYYELQISTDVGFTVGGIVVDIDDINAVNYPIEYSEDDSSVTFILPDVYALIPASYYVRVKAFI